MTSKRKLSIPAAIAAALMITCAPAALADYNESPMLTERVSAGDLPPVGERLPSNPQVLSPAEIGTYGGTWRSALKGTFDNGWIRRTVGYDPLMRYDFDWAKVVPNVAESVEVNDDATVFTFKLREGHRWSDGKPFTAEDVVFALEDVIKHPEFVGAKPAFALDLSAEAKDDTTLVITSSEPNGLLLENIASVNGGQFLRFQKEYCSQFHPDYNPDAEANAQAAGAAGWGEHMRNRCGVDRNFDADRPSLWAWVMVEPYDGINTEVVWERNPYYFKVDSENNQLPYIDRLNMTQVEDTEAIVLKGIAGEIDFMNRHIDSVANKPVFFDSQESGGYRLYDTIPADMNTAMIQLNLNVDDPVFNELFNNKDFRIALSHAIDREEIIDVVYAGQGEPYQAAPRPTSPYYNETLAKQYTEYDPDTANELLDAMGLTERDGNGIRLTSDGQPISIRADVTSDLAVFLDIAELVKAHWAEVGVDFDVRKAERSLVYEKKDSNQHMAHIWKGDGGLGDAILDPRYYMPFNAESAFAIRWAATLFDPTGDLATEPPEAVKRQQDLYNQLKTATSQEEKDRLFNEILDIAVDQFYVIGISLPPKSYGIATNEMRNIPEDQPHAWIYPNPGPMETSVLFKAQ
ncbi:ABC transporter substrate-binding protein [Bauldia sp.]|uniref:ABC transporter substrate-binding protein n=1 Tax=Bauldia sp. TaxID=2575872 RepID=UPI003BAA15E6